MPEQNEPLSERELEILRLVATGAANKEIARQLTISPNTVKVHLRNIFTKAGVFSRTEATLYAIQLGLVNPSAAQALPDEGETEDVPTDSIDLAAPTSAQPVMDPTQAPSLALSPSGAGSALVVDAPARKRNPAFWQVGLIVILFLLVLGSGAYLARTFAPTPIPTVSSASSLTSQHWSTRADLPSARKGMGIAEYENNFYLIGGESTGGVDGAVYRYSPVDNRWRPLAPKPTPVTDAYAVLLGEKIYVPGGRQANGKPTSLLEVYDPRSNTWESKKSLPVPVSAYALAPFEGRIYLFGGMNGSQYLNSVLSYDPNEDTWRTHTALSAPRAFASAVSANGKIHVLGGFNGSQVLSNHDVYFPTRDTGSDTAWETLSPMPQGRYGMGSAALAGMIFLIGGASEGNVVPNPPALEFQIQTNQWGIFEAPAENIGINPALLASGNFLYVMGGEVLGSQPVQFSNKSLSYQAIYTISVPIISK